ncbi:MAG: putative NAD(P)H nitroreductase YdjA [Luteibacter sp.]|uniref:nitroreductase family protein n=1 Tax=Luteibacter sp. TaxID=1886636 RepID=UPI00137C8FEB|nr:nitroreductase [Luteibacter sp.]KAF1009639.1 MAG: putative NAD(P)H nitroreductase YdjA [Luteibacter sp.]
MSTSPLDFLLERRSVPSRQLTEPAPDDAQLRRLIDAAIRVPDHGKLDPFRIRILRGDAKREFGRRLARRAVEANPDLSDAKRDKERNRYEHAPLVLVVTAKIDGDSKVPELEQQITAGCVAYNLMLGVQALDFGAQWLTGWAAYDREVAKLLDMKKSEHVVGFLHIGTPSMVAPERERPRYDDIVSEWTP